MDSIRHGLSSTASCSPATVSLLQQLLTSTEDDTTREKSRKPNPKISGPTAAASATNSSAKLKGRGRPKTQLRTVATVQIHSEEAVQLKSQEKLILATETVNAALKNLSEALKQPAKSLAKPASPSKDNPRPVPVTAQPVARPLKSRSPNSPDKRSAVYRSLSTTDAKARQIPGIVATAECARAAFAYLRANSKNTRGDAGDLQLENGILAFVGKCLGHGLESIALKELKMLKTRLGRGKTTGDGSSRQATASQKDSIVDLLTISGDFHKDSLLLPLAITYQAHVLKAIAARKRPAEIALLPEQMELHRKNSPASLILLQATNPDLASKCARQLESLSNTLLSMCPSVSSAEDSIACDIQRSAAPFSTFRLQCLAFRFRLLWWGYSGHKAVPEKELWAPLSRCFAAYYRRCTSDPGERYILARDSLEELESSLKRLKYDASDPSTGRSLISRTMSSLAQSSGDHNEAIRWTMVADSSDSGANKSEARLAASAVRLATLKLQDPCQDQVVEQLHVAYNCLTSSMKGDASDLDALLLEVAGFRRALTKVYLQERKLDDGKHDLAHHCTIGISNCLRFLTRYLGSAPTEGMDVKASVRYGERLIKTQKAAPGFMESAIICCKFGIKDKTMHWDALDAALQDCYHLNQQLRYIDGAAEATSNSATVETHQTVLRITSLYWTYYARESKESLSMRSPAFKSLQRSIDILRSGNQPERNDGSFTSKLEKMAEIYLQSQQFRMSYECIQEAMNEHIRNGAVDAVANIVSSCSVETLWNLDGEPQLLSRSLEVLHAVVWRGESSGVPELDFFNNSELQEDRRALLLERQLYLYCCELLKPQKAHDVPIGKLSRLFEDLLDIYDEQTYPIRRQRVVLHASRLMHEYPELLGEKVVRIVEQSTSIKSIQSTKDSRLTGFGEHLTASIQANLAIRGTPVQLSRIEESLQTWQAIVDQSSQNLGDRIENLPGLISQLNSIADFFNVQGYVYLRIPALCLLGRILELQSPCNSTAVVENLSALSLQYLRSGYSGKAGLTLAKAQQDVATKKVSAEAMVTHHLAYAEYFLSIGALNKCEESLATAEGLGRNSVELSNMARPKASLVTKIKLNQLLSDALYSFSLLKLETGYAGSALSYAKRCVKLLQRNWALLENGYKPGQRVESNSAANSDSDTVHNKNNKPSGSQEVRVVIALSTTHDALKGTQFWSLVPALRRSYYNLSKVFAHHGQFTESVYWIEQAQRIAVALATHSPLLQNFSSLAQCWIGADQVEKAQTFLDQAMESSTGIEPCLDLVVHQISVAQMWMARSETDDAIESLDTALQTIEKLAEMPVAEHFDCFKTVEDKLVASMMEMRMDEPAPPPSKLRKGRTTKTPVAKPASKGSRTTKSKKTPAVSASHAGAECAPLLSIRAQLLRDKASLLLDKEEIAAASEAVILAEESQIGQHARVAQQIVTFRQLFHQVIKAMASDSAFSVLAESTVSVPALPLVDSKLSDQPAGRTSLLSSPKNSISKPSATRKLAKPRATPKKPDFKDMLRRAADYLADVHGFAMQTCSTDVIHRLCGLLAGASVYLSATNQSHRMLSHPVHLAMLLDQPRIIALKRDICVAWIDGRITKKEELLDWPTVHIEATGDYPMTDSDSQSSTDSIPPSSLRGGADSGATSAVHERKRSRIDPRSNSDHTFDALLSSVDKPTTLTATQFQQEYVDVIPESWTAISLSLNEGKDELYLTRYRSGQTPFIIRLPMTRHKDHSMDEDEFSYEAAKSELLDIVEQSNETTHGSRYINTKEAKKEWWAAREALDARMRGLLLNVENIWLGGFRGIFSQQARQPALLSRFQKSLLTSLNRHLPSRQGRGQPKSINLDPRILELFTGLGDPRDESVDLDESLVDLLYFVVDILQFNGERNAYDEIDFDSLVVETTDALKSYHSASVAALADPSQHTILILDKHIHCFPWESLPSLIELNVSRLPSLECLRSRIITAKASRKSDSTGSPNGHHISRSSGASLVNPSGDLPNTQKIMSPLLQSLPKQWSHSTTAPREPEVTDLLSTQSLFLYFGHGSGSQYVRNRSVRRLPQCPTAWLMGCSSSAVTDHGALEPSGMVLSYMAAGAPAVVGTLWDVTDKDCDRASVKTGEAWGLWAGGEAADAYKLLAVKAKKSRMDTEQARGARVPVKSAGAGLKRAAVAKGPAVAERVGLVQAVRMGREECYLRYLNGAALVVYGIPVFLDD